jgi:RHS repeat-associated protein
MRWRNRIALLLSAILIETLLPSLPSSASVRPAPSVVPSPSPTRRPITPQVVPFPTIARSLMGPPFASDALSHLDPIFGPQRYGASFGDPIDVQSGAYNVSTTDLSVHGRGLNFAFTRTYNSADDWYEPDGSSFMGPGWRHSYWWEIIRAPAGGSGCGNTLIRGDGKREPIVADGTNGDFSACTFAAGITTVTMRDQTRYVFGNRFDYEPGEYTVYSLYQLLRIELPTGDRVVLTYAGSPRGGGYEPVLSMVTDTVGRTYHFSYDAAAHLVRIDDPAGRAALFGYDAAGRLTSAIDPTGAVTRYAYDGTTRHIATYTDPDGRVRATNSYDIGGQVTQQVDGEGYVTARSIPGASAYDITDARGTVTRYNYCICGIGLIQERTWVGVPYGSTFFDTFYGYDAHDNRNQITDRLGHVTNLTYEARANANVLSRTDPTGAGTSYQYDSKNNLTRMTDARGFVTDRTYDPTTNALLTERRQLDAAVYATTTYSYADSANPGLPTTITSPRGSLTRFAYDATGNLVTRIDPDGDVTTYVYDALGRQASVTDPDGRTAVTAYDAVDRIAAVTDPLGHSTGNEYDSAGNKTSITDRNGGVTTYGYDHNARLASVQQRPVTGITYATSLTRDGNGNVTRVTEGNGTVRDSTYDAFDQVASTTEYTSQGTLTTTYSGDAMGNVSSRTMPDGVATTFSYDALYRLTSVTAPGVLITYGYDLAGNRTAMTDETGTSTYTYDGAGRMTSAAAPGGTITYAYDLDGNRTTIGYPGAGIVGYAYTPAGRLSTVTDWANRLSTYTYRPSGLVSSVSYPNGMLASYDYDAAGRLTSLSNEIGATTITSHGYTLDPEGNRTSVAEFVSGITAPGALDTIAYSYDGLNRLTGSTGALTEGFTLDGASNVTSRTGPAATYSYDGADRLQSDGSLTFGWSAADRVVFRGPPPPPPPPPPAVAFRAQSTSNNGSGATSLVINRPAGTQPGDLLLVFIYGGGGTVVGPSGWTDIDQQTYANLQLGRVFYRIAATTDPASWTWTFGSSSYYDIDDHVTYTYQNAPSAVGSILAYSGVDPNSPVSPGTASANTGSNASIVTNAITTGYQNELVVASYGQQSQSPVSTPVGWTNRVSTATGYSAGTIKVEEKIFAQAGWTDSLWWNGAPTNQWVAFMVGLKPAPPPPPPPPPPGDYFSYDPLDRLTGSTVSGTARSYAYDGDGLLRSRTQAGSTTTFLWDPASSPSGLLQLGPDRIVYGLDPLYGVTANGTTTVLARDGLGSVRAEVSQTGAVAAGFRYRAYGDLAQSYGLTAPSLVGYAGELRDSTGLIYLRARWYDPVTGRFVTRDPVVGDLQTPLSLNAFIYAQQTPTRLTDPSGKCPMCWGAVFGFAGYFVVTQFVTHERFDWGQAAVATATGAATGGLSTVAELAGITGAAAVGTKFFGGAVIGNLSGATAVMVKTWEGHSIEGTDVAAMPVGAAVNAAAAVLGPPEPHGTGWVSAGLIAANGLTSSGYEWLQRHLEALSLR